MYLALFALGGFLKQQAYIEMPYLPDKYKVRLQRPLYFIIMTLSVMTKPRNLRCKNVVKKVLKRCLILVKKGAYKGAKLQM